MPSLIIPTADLLANDVGESITVYSVTSPSAAGATVTFDATAQTVTYSIDDRPEYPANDTFSYTIRDVVDQTSTAAVTVTLVPGEVMIPAPIAVKNAFRFVGATPDSVSMVISFASLLANDEGSAISVTALGTPTHGTATLEADGVHYTRPDSGVTADAFTYTITDSVGQTASALVEIDLSDEITMELSFSNAAIQASTLVTAYPEGSVVTAADAIENCFVTLTDDGYVIYNSQDRYQDSRFRITISVPPSTTATQVYRVPALSNEQPGDTSSEARQPDGGYYIRRGTRVLDPNSFVTAIYPSGTRFVVQEYDQSYTDVVYFQTTAGTTITRLVGELNSAIYLDVSLENGVLYFDGTDSGTYDIAYRLPGTTEWLHADRLFDASATDRPSEYVPNNAGPVDPVPGEEPPPEEAGPAPTLAAGQAAVFGDSYTLYRQVATGTGSFDPVVRLWKAPVAGNVLVAVASHFYAATVKAGWDTLRNFANAQIRDDAVWAYRLADGTETDLSPFSVGDSEQNVVVFELPADMARGKTIEAFQAVDLNLTYSRFESLNANQFLLGAAFGSGGQVPTVTGATPVTGAATGLARSRVMPFTLEYSETVDISVPPQEDKRLIYTSLRIG